MKIDFSKLDYKFYKKPIVVGGKAMEYYNLRKAGDDIDLIVCKEDIIALAKKYPKFLKDLWGDFGVAVNDFEVWKSIRYQDYEDLLVNAAEEENYYVISLQDLLFQKAMAMDIPKYMKDLQLIVKEMKSLTAKKYNKIKNENKKIVSSLSDIEYVEKTGN